ncbi:ribonuclease R [Croceicoccus naphthovorans]|uniref:Ribonuclease R n=1 Tax=Croceicoccus naphthovorans TaxID=1348774 RepID=A0A0G3XFU8_9SPHN|nr:ribonuclease R [Croceicoccus naphthovorans]AKM10022.1 ribonuclease R [Croceicoccus naphthovorans]MBB3991095.1 ribonuclease R [Croceicoccus naphthovorans]
MARTPKRPTGLPNKEQVMEFIRSSDTPAGKREIAKAFGLKGQEKIALKALLKDMADEGLIDGDRRAFHRMGGVPKVTVLRVVAIEEGDAIAIPDNWQPDDAMPPPRIRLIESKGRGKSRQMPALRKGDRVLARTEETGTGYLAHPMKKLPQVHDSLMGVVEIDGSGKGWLAPIDKSVRSSVPIADLGGAEKGNLVLAEPAGKSPRAGVRVVELLGDPLAPKSYSLIAIHKHDIPYVFPAEALSEADIAAKLPLSEDKREDLRALPIVGIDPADARDHDDAIWAMPDDDPANAGGWKALVAIADVSFYVRPGSAVDREARKRGNSVYFPDRVVPMLPEVLSAEVCSLGEGEARAAMACHMTIDRDGRVRDWRFTRAIVQIAEVIAYEDAQARIDDGSAADHLKHLWACWKVLHGAREARDPLDLDLPERRVVLDEKGRIAEIAVRERLDAHKVVEEFMIAANVAAAKALEAKAAPVVYRVHEPPSREKLVALKDYLATMDRNLALGQVITPSLFNRLIKDVSDEAEKALVMEQVLRSQTQAYYGPKNAGHFGLALGSYAHFTSPIRRYSDLLVHRALVEAYGLEQPKPKDATIPAHSGLSDRDRASLERVTDAISKTERRAMEAERDTIDRYVAAWLSGKVGETFDTRVTGVQKFGLFATILGFGGDGLVPVSVLGDERFHYDDRAQVLRGERTGTEYRSGDRMKLRLAEANPLTGALKFEPPEFEGRIEPRGGRPQGKPKRQNKTGYMQGKRGRPGNIRHSGKRK